MKKTFITLLALAGVSMGITEYNLKYAIDGSTGDNCNLTAVDIVTGQDLVTLTLTSYVIEFTFTEYTNSYSAKQFYTYRGDTENGIPDDGLVLHTWGNTTDKSTTMGIGTASAHIGGAVAFSVGDTLRLGYDAKTETAYLFNVSKAGSTLQTVDLSDTVTSENASKFSFVAGPEDERWKGACSFVFTSGSKMSFSKVYDMSGIAGDSKAFASYMIPEPATATLSLLALAGLAMRRRRK